MPGISVSKICVPFGGGGIDWSSYWKKQLSRNSDIVESSCYPALTGILAWGSNTGAVRSFLIKDNYERIRQNGTITKVSLYIGAITAAIQAVYFQVWRKDGTTYDLVGEENIRASLSANATCTATLSNPIIAQKGDFVSISVDNGATIGALFVGSTSGVTATLRFYSGTRPTGNNFAWDSADGYAYNLPVKTYMQAPMTILIGDSIMAGHPTNYSFIENSLTVDTTCDLSVLLEAINNSYVIQNMGIGSQTSTQINARFAADVVALKPKIAIINGGVNDIAGGSISKATFLSNYTSMLNSCLTNDILPVVCKILPWTNGTNEQMQTRDEWMADLYALVNSETYNGAVWVDFDTDMGKNRASGDAGNLWDLKTTPDYDNDGVHPTALGYAKMAEVINAAIVAKGYQLV